jgi:AhpC/TSA family
MTKKLSILFLLLTTLSWMVGCDSANQQADVKSLTKELPSSPTPPPPPSLPPIDATRTDLNRVMVGSSPPDFALEDINKKIVKLSDFQGKQNVVLVFYRGHF